MFYYGHYTHWHAPSPFDDVGSNWMEQGVVILEAEDKEDATKKMEQKLWDIGIPSPIRFVSGPFKTKTDAEKNI